MPAISLLLIWFIFRYQFKHYFLSEFFLDSQAFRHLLSHIFTKWIVILITFCCVSRHFSVSSKSKTI